MKSTIVVSFDKNFGIGIEEKLPWHITEDLAHFKKITTGQSVILGSKTYDSIPKKNRPLPGRTNIVLTRHAPTFRTEDCIGKSLVFVGTPNDALRVAEAQNVHTFVIGGEQIYKVFLDRDMVDEVIASEVKGEYQVDTWFPYKKIEKWDRQVIKEYEQFALVRYITIAKLRQKLDEAERIIKSYRETVSMLEARIASHKTQCGRQYRYAIDYLPYGDDEYDR